MHNPENNALKVLLISDRGVSLFEKCKQSLYALNYKVLR